MDTKKILISAAVAAVFASGSALAAEPKQGGTLTVPSITPAFVENFNPFANVNKDKWDAELFEPLLTYNNMTGEIDYRLAEKMEYSDDLLSITYTLREGLKWSDGSPLTAKDVAFSYNLVKKHPQHDAGALWSSERLESVEALDDRRVRFNLTKVDTAVEWFIAGINYYILPEHVWSKVPAEEIETFANTNPVGSGPLTTVKYVRTQQAELCRNPHYYLEGRPYLDCIKYRAYNDNSQIQPALMNGDIDWGSNFIPDVDKTFVAADPENHKYWYPANDAIHIYLNTKEAPFNDITLRKAFSMALDREMIVELAAYGYPTVNQNPGGIGDIYKPYYSQEVMDKYGHLAQYNPDAAIKLLDDAGYVDRNGDGFREAPDGSKIEFGIDVVSGWTDWVNSVQMVTEYLQEIGINAKVNPIEWGAYDRRLKEGSYTASINWSLVATNPIQAYFEYFHTSRVGEIWHAGHGVNSPEIDAKLEKFGTIADPVEQQQILNELQEFTAQSLPFVPLFSNATWFQYNESEIAGWPTADNAYVQPVFYDRFKKMTIFNNLYLK